MFQMFHKKRGSKGFTLAELLIVVAIIAVLVAVAIPIFSASVGKAQASVDAANLRSANAVVSAYCLTDCSGDWSKITVAIAKEKANAADIPATSASEGGALDWSTTNHEFIYGTYNVDHYKDLAD